MPGFTPFKSMHDISHVEVDNATRSADQRYNALRNLDDHSDASTEVGDDWDAEGAEKPWRIQRRSRWKRVQGYSWLANTILLLVVIGLLVEKRWKHEHSHQYEFAGDLTGFAPRCRGICSSYKGVH